MLLPRLTNDTPPKKTGREGPGKAYRLYTEQAFDSLELATVPEILRSNLASVVLQVWQKCVLWHLCV